ncbi:MAG TPA: AAA family ATPase [Gallionellaceae bacterium]|nr:AAA family ATPase [Gallionellaceae bacterium]
MDKARQADYITQSRLVHALLDSLRGKVATKSARLVETHISWVLLAGHYAYKIKKAVDLGFLNFSSLQARQYFCEEEIRLNRRLAPKIYLGVIPIGGGSVNPVLGAQPAMEYAVRMRRFAVSRQLDRLLAHNKILPQHIDSLAATMARFHGNLPAAGVDSSFGTPEIIRLDAEQNFAQLQALLTEPRTVASLAALRSASDSEYAAHRSLFGLRLLQGYVRECHGDLHLGNIVLVDDQPVPFDGIEFNPRLRWIDVMSEVAFTVMDLLHYGRADLAWRFLNAWLEATGDYAGIKVLRFYIAYRAMVRAKVSAIRAAQPGISARALKQAQDSCSNYLELAADCFARKKAVLIITHGLPGSGKTTFAQIALERLQAIRLRSDVERKRLYGLSPLADSRASTGMDLYSSEVTQRTYARLHDLARELLGAGYTVIVDAAFLKQEERAKFQQLAVAMSAPFAIASVRAASETLRARIMQRHRAANDASEADITVLEKLLRTHEPLTSHEQAHAAEFFNEKAGLAADSAGWNSLQLLLGSSR